jgi:hypothetical protein
VIDSDPNTNASASQTAPYPTEYLKMTGFGFAIPVGAVIKGIEVKVKSSMLGNGASITDGHLVTAGTIDTATNQTYQSMPYVVSGFTTTYTLGNATDRWGAVLGYSTVNNTSFGVALRGYIDAYPGDFTTLNISDVTMNVYYTTAASTQTGDIQYFDNSAVNTGTSSATAADPSNGSTIAEYKYYESDPFRMDATLSAGTNKLFDLPLVSTANTVGKTYCLRLVKEDGSLINGYDNYPEITFTNGGGPPAATLDQMLRGGQSVVEGVKSPFSW